MDWWAIPGYVIGVIGVAVAIYFGVRRSNVKDPVWGCKTIKLIDLESKAPPQIRVNFGEKPVKNVYRTIPVFLTGVERLYERKTCRRTRRLPSTSKTLKFLVTPIL